MDVGVFVVDGVARGDSLVAAFERWVREHLSEPFRIGSAAEDLGVTVRSLQRAMQAQLGMYPRDFANDIRLEGARTCCGPHR